LNYVTIMRQDVSLVSVVSQFLNALHTSHLDVVICISRYLRCGKIEIKQISPLVDIVYLLA